MMRFCVIALTLALSLGPALGVNGRAATLVINANTSEPASKAVFEQLIEKFKTENPDIEVEFKVFDHEGFKTAIRNLLTSQPPDVVTWFAGERMKTFVERGLFEDISDLWQQQGLDDAMASSRSAVSVDGRQYGVPYGYYQWGVYYRRDLFEQHGLSVPRTWDDLLAVGKTLNDNGIKPVAIGTKFPWSAAGWFDYLNLRVNGLDFHMDLMMGKAAYTDARVRKTFDHWRQLIDAGFYIDNHASYSWQEAQPFQYRGQAAMYLTGHFIVPMFPEEIVAQMDYFQFPVIDENIALYEAAPTDTLHIPSKAENKTDARKFLAFMARADNQTELNRTLGNLPPNRNSEVPDDRFLKTGFEVLSAASGLAQFYDRDTNPEMAKIGMQGFQEFMVKPERLDNILERLEKARKRIFRQ
jgi:multiple sugar transport system substrate-binding protein